MPVSIEILNPESQELQDPVSQEMLYRNAMDLKDWIASARRHAKLTMEQLGEKIGRTKGNVSAWERGAHEPSWEQIRAIANATNYPLSELLLDSPSPPNRLPAAAATAGQIAYALASAAAPVKADAKEQIAQLAAMMITSGPSASLAAAIDEVTQRPTLRTPTQEDIDQNRALKLQQTDEFLASLSADLPAKERSEFDLLVGTLRKLYTEGQERNAVAHGSGDAGKSKLFAPMPS